MGEYYQPFEGEKLPGVGIFPAYTEASHDRMIGNIVIKLTSELVNQRTSETSGQLVSRLAGPLLVGFENHSGKTFLKKDAQPFGKVIKGFIPDIGR